MKKKITGEWDGQPIWREETSKERLEEVLAKYSKIVDKTKYPNLFISSKEQEVLSLQDEEHENN